MEVYFVKAFNSMSISKYYGEFFPKGWSEITLKASMSTRGCSGPCTAKTLVDSRRHQSSLGPGRYGNEG